MKTCRGVDGRQGLLLSVLELDGFLRRSTMMSNQPWRTDKRGDFAYYVYNQTYELQAQTLERGHLEARLGLDSFLSGYLVLNA